MVRWVSAAGRVPTRARRGFRQMKMRSVNASWRVPSRITRNRSVPFIAPTIRFSDRRIKTFFGTSSGSACLSRQSGNFPSKNKNGPRGLDSLRMKPSSLAPATNDGSIAHNRHALVQSKENPKTPAFSRSSRLVNRGIIPRINACLTRIMFPARSNKHCSARFSKSFKDSPVAKSSDSGSLLATTKPSANFTRAAWHG